MAQVGWNLVGGNGGGSGGKGEGIVGMGTLSRALSAGLILIQPVDRTLQKMMGSY